MRLVKEEGLYVCYTTPEERHLPKGAGFRWNPYHRRWETPYRARALRLAKWADPELKAELEATEEASRATDAELEIPAPPGLAYLGYQKVGIKFALECPATLIADEQGLGKTVQVLGLINAREDIRRVLVVCPLSVKLNWTSEAKRWLVRPHTIYICRGKPKGDELTQAEREGHLLLAVINYDLLHTWAEPLRQWTWDLVVADEAHYVKDCKSRRSVYLYGGTYRGGKVSPIPARRKIALTGTPIVNRPVELYPILRWLDPDLFPNFMEYARRYCNAYHNGWGWDFKGASNLEELQQILRTSVMIRRLKSEVLHELPAKLRQVIEIPAEGALIKEEARTLAHIKKELKKLKERVKKTKATDDEKAYQEALAALNSARRAAFNEIARLRHESAKAKVPYLLEHLENLLKEGKVICFAHHRDVLEKIYKRFSECAVMVHGETDPQARQEAVERFQNDPEVKLFIGSITATAEGITLTAASRVVFAELDWRPSKMAQAEDRAHRIGQHSSVLVQILVLEGSIDARIAKTLVRKMEIIEKALDKPGEGEEAEPDLLDLLEEEGEDA